MAAQPTELERVQAAVNAGSPRSDIPAIHGHYEYPMPHGEGASLIMSLEGDYILAFTAGGTALRETRVTYDAALLRREAIDPDLGRSVWTGVLSSGPDLVDPFLSDLLLSQAQAARALESGTAVIGSLDGRPTVELVTESAPRQTDGDETYALRRETAVDQQTGLIVRSQVTYSDGTTIAGSGSVDTAAVIVPADLVQDPTAQGRDAGFELVGTLAEAASRASYVPLIPTWIPEGFTLMTIAYADAPVSYLEGTRQVMVLTYRSGAWEFHITFREARSQVEWTDPYDPYGDAGYTSIDVYDSALGTFTVVTQGVTHAWAVVGDRVITIGGALGPQAIRAIIDGLQEPSIST